MPLFNRDPKLPDFIGIGAMRAGTSWLRKQLDLHPQIWTATPKELHFFDRHFVDDPASYAGHFAQAPRKSTIGEITPAYAVLPTERIASIKAWMPNAKLLFMMRDPVERAWSHARKDFPQFRNKPASEATVDELIAFTEQPAVASRGDYLSCLKAWQKHFPAAQIWCGFLEQAAADPVPVLQDLFGFLGVDATFEIDETTAKRRENSRPEEALPEKLRSILEERLYAGDADLSELLGRSLPWASTR